MGWSQNGFGGRQLTDPVYRLRERSDHLAGYSLVHALLGIRVTSRSPQSDQDLHFREAGAQLFIAGPGIEHRKRR